MNDPPPPIPGLRCVPCVLDDLVGALKVLDIDPGLRQETLDTALRWMAEEFPARHSPSYYITGVHRILKRMTGIEVPFAELRAACNRVGREIADRVRIMAEKKSGYARFQFLAHWALAGNDLDFRTVGTGYDFDTRRIEAELGKIAGGSLHVDRLPDIFAAFKRIDRLLYIPDNVGEIAFDRLLVEEFQSWGIEVTVPYRGGPITSDATLEDFEAVGLDRQADHVIEAGPDTLGIQLDELTEEMVTALTDHEYILTKGQANYYMILLDGPRLGSMVASLLTTKCDLIAGVHGFDVDRIRVATLADFR